MAGARALATLAAAVQDANGKLVLVGDDRQLPEIEAGGAFHALAQQLDAVEIRDVRRQRSSWDRDALAALRDGDVEQFARAYAENGRLVATPNAEAARMALVDDWWATWISGADARMIAHRRSDVADLNARARRRMRETGRLGAGELSAGGREYAVGDRVVAMRNADPLGIVNGEAGVVAALDPAQLTLELDAGRRVRLPLEYVADGLDHGYAITAHRAQGRRHRRRRVRARLGRALPRMGLHRPLAASGRRPLLRERQARVPQRRPGASWDARRRDEAGGRDAAGEAARSASRSTTSTSHTTVLAIRSPLMPFRPRRATSPEYRDSAATATWAWSGDVAVVPEPQVDRDKEPRAVAGEVAALLCVAGATTDGLLTAAQVAARFNVDRSWVYAHAEELGVVRLGSGPRPRLRFDGTVVAQAARREAGASFGGAGRYTAGRNAFLLPIKRPERRRSLRRQ